MEVFLITFPLEDFVANGIGSQIVWSTWWWAFMVCVTAVETMYKYAYDEQKRGVQEQYLTVSPTLSTWKMSLWQIPVTEDFIKTLVESVIEGCEKTQISCPETGSLSSLWNKFFPGQNNIEYFPSFSRLMGEIIKCQNMVFVEATPSTLEFGELHQFLRVIVLHQERHHLGQVTVNITV